MKRAYFARPITHFGTQQERIDIACIEMAGFGVVDIANKETQEQYKQYGMNIFKPIIKTCDCLFFLAFEDGAIGAGVAKEISWASDYSIPIFELPVNIDSRTLSVDETRERVRPK